jgi:hypothetical protein
MSDDDVNDELWSQRRVSTFFNVHPKTIDRWEKNPKLQFPDYIQINGQKYRYRNKVRRWVSERARKANAAAD